MAIKCMINFLTFPSDENAHYKQIVPVIIGKIKKKIRQCGSINFKTHWHSHLLLSIKIDMCTL